MHGLLGFLFLVGANPAPSPAWHQDLASVHRAVSAIQTIQASFVQTRTLKILRKPLVSRGVIAFRRPNDLRWEYQSPLPVLLVVRAGEAQRLLKHGPQWVSDASAKLEAMKLVLGEISLWLNGNFAASRTFRPELRPATRDRPARVDLLPLDAGLGKIIAHIGLSLGERPGAISAIDIFEQDEGVTHITFENPRYDEAVPDERFDTPP
jgi:hypothetical protein